MLPSPSPLCRCPQPLPHLDRASFSSPRHPPAGALSRSHTAIGAAAFWLLFMYCFWRMGTYLPGVPIPTNGIFKMQQVQGGGLLHAKSHDISPCQCGFEINSFVSTSTTSLDRPPSLNLSTSPSSPSLLPAGHQPGGGAGHVDDRGAIGLRHRQRALLLPLALREAGGGL